MPDEFFVVLRLDQEIFVLDLRREPKKFVESTCFSARCCNDCACYVRTTIYDLEIYRCQINFVRCWDLKSRKNLYSYVGAQLLY